MRLRSKNVLLTGASSFTGFWFARALVAAGHRVIAPLRGRVDGYEGVRGERVRRLAGLVTVIEGCPFGSAAFLSLVCGDAWDLFAHHAGLFAPTSGNNHSRYDPWTSPWISAFDFVVYRFIFLWVHFCQIP